MKHCCYETEKEFIYCVEDAEGMIYENLLADDWWTKADGNRFVKIYPLDTGWNDAWYLKPEYKKAITNNFARLGKSWIEGVFDWQKVLLSLAQMFVENNVEWYIFGNVSEAVRGVKINPHDIDIVVHTKDFYKLKDLTYDCVIEPFADYKGTWHVRYFGKLCIDGASIDIAADDEWNLESRFHPYDKAVWNGFDVYLEPLKLRYEVEIERERKDRIKVIEEFMKNNPSFA